MRRIITVLVLAVLLIITAQYAPTVQAEAPRVKVVQLDHPVAVQAGSFFDVTIQVSYSDRFGMIDVGIWDVGKGSVIQSLVSNVTLSGPGEANFTFSLRSPSHPSRWYLEGISRAWVNDAWFNDDAGFVPFFVQVLDNATLTLTGLQPATKVTVDGTSYATNTSIVSEQLKFGVHSVEVPSLIQEGPGSRLLFVGWSDGESSNPRVIVLNGDLTISPIYERQYLLTVDSNTYSAGSGWYQDDRIVQFVVPERYESPAFFGLFTSYFQFSSWSGDSKSTSPLSTLVMNGPKTVAAQWTRTSLRMNLTSVTYLFIVASCVLVCRISFAKRGTLTRKGSVKSFAFLLLIMLTFTLVSKPVTASELPMPANASVVNIGDAYWYYWSNPGSDTCIFWLGGGTEFSQGGYLINPLEYESFGTIRFLQDLARFYCVVALERGAVRSRDTTNRTIDQELIQSQYSIDREVHRWISSQGYRHAFLLGYSVGAIAAVSIALVNSQDWTSSDGLVLITALLPASAVSDARSLKANLLLLYGHAPSFESTGFNFFENAPKEGWRRSSYFHKEFHVLDDMGHEVWSPLKTNTYSPLALTITVNFIEKSKALQLGRIPETRLGTGSSHDNSGFDIVSVTLPPKIYWDEPFFVNALLTSRNCSTGVLVAYDSVANRTLAVTDFSISLSSGRVNVHLNMPSVNSSQTSFSLLVMQKRNDNWQVVAKSYTVRVDATSQVTLQILTGVPDNRILIDGAVYYTSSTGLLQLQTCSGVHTIELQPAVARNDTRYLLTGWSDAAASPLRTIQLDNDTSLMAVYRSQYRVSVVSPFGATSGYGWRDANSTLEPQIVPIALTEPTLLFDHWTYGKEAYGLGAPIVVRSPMIIRADWTSIEPSRDDGGSAFLAAFSIGLFMILLVLDLNRTRKSINH